MKKILLVDDDLVFRELLKQALENEGYQVLAAEDGVMAMIALKEEHIDLILLDLMMPRMSGFDLLLAREDQAPVIVISAIDNEEERIRGYELGADDFLTKPFSMKELLVRMNAIKRRVDVSQQRLPSNGSRALAIEFDEINHLVQVHEQAVNLTQTEFKVLKYLYDRKGKVVTKQELQRSILQKDLGQFDRNLDMHISNTRKKLANTQLQRSAINTVRGQGYCFGSV